MNYLFDLSVKPLYAGLMNTLRTLLATTTAALVLGIPALANGNTGPAATIISHVDRLVADAKKAQNEAREIGVLLKAKQPDFSAIQANMAELAAHVAGLKQGVADFEAAYPTLSAKQQAEFDRMKSAVAVLAIFLDNKSEILAGSSALEQRKLLRAKAEGIAKRAELVQLSAHRLRG